MKFLPPKSMFGQGAPAATTPATKSTGAAKPPNPVVGEVAEKLSSFDLSTKRGREDAEAQRQTDATDSEHWFAVDLETREQKEALLHALGLFDEGDKYLSGFVVAERLAALLRAPAEQRSAAIAALDKIKTMRAPKWSARKTNNRLARLV